MSGRNITINGPTNSIRLCHHRLSPTHRPPTATDSGPTPDSTTSQRIPTSLEIISQQHRQRTYQQQHMSTSPPTTDHHCIAVDHNHIDSNHHRPVPAGSTTSSRSAVTTIAHGQVPHHVDNDYDRIYRAHHLHLPQRHRMHCYHYSERLSRPTVNHTSWTMITIASTVTTIDPLLNDIRLFQQHRRQIHQQHAPKVSTPTTTPRGRSSTSALMALLLSGE